MTRCRQHLSQPQRLLLHISARPTRRVHILELLLPQSRETCHGKDAGDGLYRRESGERAPSRPSPFCLTAPPSPARSSLSHRVPSDDAAFLPFPPGRGHRPRPSSFLAQMHVTRGPASSHFCIASTPSSHSRPRVNDNRRGTAGSTRPDLEIQDHQKRTIGVRIAMDNERDEERMFYTIKEQPFLSCGVPGPLSSGLAGRCADSGTPALTGMGAGVLRGDL
jgi:hypothetical protein